MKFQSRHWDLVKTSNDENIDPFDLVKDCVNHHADDCDKDIVNNFFTGYVGRFLSVGANNGADQTYDLLTMGWQGVYCEPDPYACVELIETVKPYKEQVTIINSAITPVGGVMDFYLALGESYVSSTLAGWIGCHTKSNNVQKILVNSLTLNQVLDRFNYEFDFVQTDVEGLDIEIVQSVDWSCVHRCKMICTEAGPAVLKQLCIQGDYMITDVTPTNSFYKKSQFILQNDRL